MGCKWGTVVPRREIQTVTRYSRVGDVKCVIDYVMTNTE